MGAVRLPKILVLTSDDFVSAQELPTFERCPSVERPMTLELSSPREGLPAERDPGASGLPPAPRPAPAIALGRPWAGPGSRYPYAEQFGSSSR